VLTDATGGVARVTAWLAGGQHVPVLLDRV
jgi:hypothetical protein